MSLKWYDHLWVIKHFMNYNWFYYMGCVCTQANSWNHSKIGKIVEVNQICWWTIQAAKYSNTLYEHKILVDPHYCFSPTLSRWTLDSLYMPHAGTLIKYIMWSTAPKNIPHVYLFRWAHAVPSSRTGNAHQFFPLSQFPVQSRLYQITFPLW